SRPARAALDGFLRAARSLHDQPPVARSARARRSRHHHRPRNGRAHGLVAAPSALDVAHPAANARRHYPSELKMSLAIDYGMFNAQFARAPFLVPHRLTHHTLFSLARLVELSKRLPASQAEYNA